MKNIRDRDWYLCASAVLALAMLFVATAAFGQDVPLDVKGGDVKAVKVVRAFPFTVHAPPKAALYFWTFPNNIRATDRGDNLLIESAPPGPLTVSVKIIDADWTAKQFVTKFGTEHLHVGDMAPIPDPKPDPPPNDSPLVRDFKAAFAGESVTDKAKLPTLIEVYRGAVAASADEKIKTERELSTVVKLIRQKFVGDALPAVRAVANQYLESRVPAINMTLDAATRKTFAAAFSDIAAALEKVR